jgi:cyclopropane fatty-acyl-phospholipid synthase-like methyltransferase
MLDVDTSTRTGAARRENPAGDAAELIASLASGTARTPALVDRYYTLCIPFYREFLGDHWHTGYYPPHGPIGPADQLRMELRIAEAAALGPGRDVLDVGCGVGGPARHLAARTGARVRGLTPNAAQLELARAIARERNLDDRVSFDLGSAGDLPYPDASFDAVLFFESPCHFPDRDQFFREVRRVLRPGGRLAGEDWLAAEGLTAAEVERYVRPVCDTWAIPTLGTRTGYAAGMTAAGLTVREAVDLREEMALARGFLVDPDDRAEVAREVTTTADPVRRLVMMGLLRLGEAVAAGAFTLGRFLAVKESRP